MSCYRCGLPALSGTTCLNCGALQPVPGSAPPQPPHPGYWLASDGIWYPPQAAQNQPPQQAYSPYPQQAQGYPTSANLVPAGPQGAAYQPAYAPQKFCPACGILVMPTAVVCVRCGTALSVPRSKGVAILLAVFLGYWTWLYTYKRDATKFWVGLSMAVVGGLTLVLLIGFVFIFAVWLWAVIDTASRSESFYQQYPNQP
jgi:hypothetical protein